MELNGNLSSNEEAPTRLEVGANGAEVNNTPPPHPTCLGIPEIAAHLGVKRATVDTWRTRPAVHFPPPDWTVGGRPAWSLETITRWHAQRPVVNRTPVPPT